MAGRPGGSGSAGTDRACRPGVTVTAAEGGGRMAGNSQRRGAMRKPGTKKGAVVGSGGQSRRAVKGRGPTPPAEARKGHPAARRAAAAAKRDDKGRPAPGPAPARGRAELPETVVGRNPVVEALRAGVPATALYVAAGLASDERVTEAIAGAGDRGHLAARGLPAGTGPADRQRDPPGPGPGRAALPVRAPGGPAGAGQGFRPGAADRCGRRGDRPAEPGRHRAVGGRVRRARRGGAGAPQRRHDGIGLAHVGRHRRPDPGGPLHQPGAHAQGLRRARG